MNWFAIALGLMIMAIGVKPAFQRAQQRLARVRRDIRDLRHRQRALSHQVRTLARESLSQRLTSRADDDESAQVGDHIKALARHVEGLAQVDRRVMVTDERRGLQETGWILLIRRAVELPQEPAHITRLWAEGRHFFFFGGDATRARRKALLRFPAAQGYEILDVVPHEGDLTEAPKLGAAQRESA